MVMMNFLLFSLKQTNSITNVKTKSLKSIDLLTAMKSGLSSITLSRSGSADLDFPIAKYTVARL